MKKLLCLFLALMMTAGLFSGCGKPQSTSSLYDPSIPVKDAGGLKLPLVNEDTPLTWSVDSTFNDLDNSYVLEKLRGMTGINIKLNVMSPSTAGEKIKVLAASKSLPDIVGQGLEPEFANDLCVQGAFAAVEDYLDVLPNFRRDFVDNKDNSWIFKSRAATDGKLYGFYGYDWARDINHGMLYRKDIFDKNGIKMWNSPETFYEALKKLKEIYPSSTPFVNKNGDQIFNRLSIGWGIIAQDFYYDESAKVWKFSDVDEKYKEMLDYIKKLYNEGLIDPEFITATQATWTSKMTQADKAFVTFDWIGRLEQFKTQTAETVPEYDLRFGNPIGPLQQYKESSQICWARYVSNNDKAETAFKLLDFCISPTGKELITMGIEGETYTLDDNGMASYIEFPDTPPTQGDLEEKYGMFLQGMYLSFDRRSVFFNFTEREQEAQDYMKDPAHIYKLDPEVTFTPEENKKKNDLIGDLQKAGVEFATKYILNNGGEKEWQAWLKDAERLGYKEIEKIYNEAQKRYDN